MCISTLAKTVLAFSAFSLVMTTTLQAKVSEKERNALIKMYEALDGENWPSAYHKWTHGDPCEDSWQSIVCNKEDTEIRIILIAGAYKNIFKGELPPEIGDLENLRYLKLASQKDLTGEIPKELSKLKKLEKLVLQEANFEGKIPKELGELDNLKILWLSNLNKIEGEIPKELNNLKNLKELSMSRIDNLEGEMPKELSNLSELRRLLINNNKKLGGSIPKEFGDFEKIEIISIYDNNITGTIPAELANLDTLEGLILKRNYLSGTIPPELANLKSIKELVLDSNLLEGVIPTELANIKEGASIFLEHNLLKGKIPSEFQDSKIKYFYIDHNGLYTDDDDLADWIKKHNAFQMQWRVNETIQTNELNASDTTDDSTHLEWELVEYLKNKPGGYTVYIQEDGGDYKEYNSTDDKYTDDMNVTDLKSGTDYCFKLETFSNYKENRWFHERVVKSIFSEEVCITTDGGCFGNEVFDGESGMCKLMEDMAGDITQNAPVETPEAENETLNETSTDQTQQEVEEEQEEVGKETEQTQTSMM